MNGEIVYIFCDILGIPCAKGKYKEACQCVFSDILDKIPMAMFIIYNGKIAWANHLFVNISEHDDRQDVIGLSVDSIFEMADGSSCKDIDKCLDGSYDVNLLNNNRKRRCIIYLGKGVNDTCFCLVKDISEESSSILFAVKEFREAINSLKEIRTQKNW